MNSILLVVTLMMTETKTTERWILPKENMAQCEASMRRIQDAWARQHRRYATLHEVYCEDSTKLDW